MMPRPEESRQGNRVPEADVAAMFDSIAPVYDRVNTLMTAGGDGRWRRAAAEASELRTGDAGIDVACGTGKLSATLAGRVGPFGRVVGVDLAPAMVAAAASEYGDLVQLTFQVGNALDLPFPDAEFDAATIAFGLRNLADFEAGFRELGRVVKPGGRVVCLELTNPPQRGWGRLFRSSFGRLAPLVAGAFGQGQAYRYLPQSLDGFPDAPILAETMRSAGLADVGYRRLALGAVALHVGRAAGPGLPGA
jgi:demethylmenaquinone methyltransferase / 2-methoxy-6-polyprenyl-1,4-benzoquinol methylase